ncbi:MAG: carboxypeptidase regulatory-like domain-containing protein [Planctomycetes bacterium]|nr:carboxypeptidase regulatory-like domain-containing protein [Planctomycetota bacterium]
MRILITLAFAILAAHVEAQTATAPALVSRSCFVVDRTGKPVEYANVNVSRLEEKSRGNWQSRIQQFDDSERWTRDKSGRFETPKSLAVGGYYNFTVEADGFITIVTPWMTVHDKTAEPVKIVLDRILSISGRVVDRQGKPVAGAEVYTSGDFDYPRVPANFGRNPDPRDANNPGARSTDASGEFKLPRVDEGAPFLFVKRSGFRFHGEVLDLTKQTYKITIARESEPPETLPEQRVVSRDVELQLAGRVLEPYLAKGLASADESTRLRTHECLARLDPARALENLAQKGFSTPFSNDYIRKAAIETLAKSDLDEARAVVATMELPEFRVYGLRTIAESPLLVNKEKRIELLLSAIPQARAVIDPAHRVTTILQISNALEKAGDAATAASLVREARPVAESLSNEGWPGYAHSCFAEALASTDLSAGLAMIKDIKDSFEFTRHHGNIAHKLAGVRPAEAESTMMLAKNAWERDRYIPRICYRMAPADLPRARRLATSGGNFTNQAWSLGVMASALAESDRAEARKLLNEAYFNLGVEPSGNAAVAGALLLRVEDVDRSLIPEYLWRAVSLRMSLGGCGPSNSGALDANLAMLVSRYDAGVAGLLWQRARQRADLLQPGGVSYDTRFLFASAATIDPAMAVEFIHSLPDDASDRLWATKNAARTAVAGALALPGRARWDFLLDRYLNLWTIDKEDL